MNNIPCTLIKDLLPSYIEKLTSDESNALVEEHLAGCPSCSKELAEMNTPVEAEKAPDEEIEFIKIINKTKKMYILKGTIFGITLIGLLVSFIVDVAINHKLTWSLIVDVSLVFFAGSISTLFFSKKNKVIRTLLVMSVMLLPMLYGFEAIINTNYLQPPVYWFTTYALPICGIWLVILWATVVFYNYARIGLWNSAGIFLLLTIVGSCWTNMIANRDSFLNLYSNNLKWIDLLAYFFCALLCFAIESIFKKRKK